MASEARYPSSGKMHRYRGSASHHRKTLVRWRTIGLRLAASKWAKLYLLPATVLLRLASSKDYQRRRGERCWRGQILVRPSERCEQGEHSRECTEKDGELMWNEREAIRTVWGSATSGFQ